MQFMKTYASGEKVKSLAERFRHYARKDSTYKDYVDQGIKSENLRYNLSWVISHIILNLHFVDRSPEVFENIIAEYNAGYGTSLNIEDFQSIYWVRTISGEVRIPSVVRSFVWKIGFDEKEGKTAEIPEGKEHLARCLQIYYRRCFESARLTIPLERLNKIIRTNGAPQLSIDFFVQKGIVSYDKEGDCYNWLGGEYTRHLRNEIGATLWLLLGSSNATAADFAQYFKLLNGAQIWVDDNLKGFLTNKDTGRIVELAVAYLQNEDDLLRSDDEFAKAWLDAPDYQHVGVGSEMPHVEFNYTSSVDFIEHVGYHKWSQHGMFDHQSTRSFCYSLLRIIIINDPKHPVPYQNVQQLLKDISRPFLVWALYKEIQRGFPEIIPHLLDDTELVPLAYKLADKVDIAPVFLKEQSDDTKRTGEGHYLKQGLWLEMFELTLQDIAGAHQYEEEYGKVLAKVLLDAAEQIFLSNNNDHNQVAKHGSLRKKYGDALSKLSSKRLTGGNRYPGPQIAPRLIFTVLLTMAKYLKEKGDSPLLPRNEFIHLQSGLLDLSIETLRLANTRIPEEEIADGQLEEIKQVSETMIALLQQLIIGFYTAEDIAVETYHKRENAKRRARRGVNDFGFEIIDWGYLFLHFEKARVFDAVNDSFEASLDFDVSAGWHTDRNREQYEKIRLYLKSLMVGFIAINKNRTQYEIEGLPVANVLEKLERQIKELSLAHSINEVTSKRIDVFDERFRYGYDMYYQPLTKLLYRSVNYFKGPARNAFIEAFFRSSINIGRMLAAMNLLDSRELTDVISKRIGAIPVETFIESSSTTTELQSALVEAANSDNHWNLAKPLMERIQEHFKRVQHYEQGTEYLLFEVNLLLAFKEKDYAALLEVPVPDEEGHHPINIRWGESMQRYYTALFKIYNDRNYKEGIGILKSLLSADAKNIQYAFHLYRAETLNAIGTNLNITSLTQAQQDWENFSNSLSDEEKSGLANIADPLNSNSLHYFATANDAVRFDQTVNELPARYLYDDEMVPVIYGYYMERDLHELAFDYIQKAQEHFFNNDTAIPPEISQLLSRSESVKLLSKYRLSLERISSLSPKNIPNVAPEIINDKRQLETFILNEIIQAARIIDEKREALRQVTHENRYNDFLQAILRLRFPFWGWSIQDQVRLGTSTGGADAGNADLVIEAGGNKIALVEAFILRDGDYTRLHILKCKKYIGSITKFYIVVYYLGNSLEFENKWTAYKGDVLKTAYPDDFSIDATIGFEDFSDQFENVDNFKIARTIHNNRNEMFHVMINLR